MNSSQVLRWCQETFHYYVIFKTSIFFILGLVFSYKLVEKTFLNILIARLNDAWGAGQYDLRRSVVVVNLLEGTTTVLVLPFAYAAAVSHAGRFKMVVLSTTICIIGLILNFRAAIDNELLDLGFFYPGLGLLALAQAAQAVSLEIFLDDQLRQPTMDDEDRRRRSKFWWTLVSFVAGIFAQFGPLPLLDFKWLTMVLLSVMGVFFLVFLLATNRYNFVERMETSFQDVRIVILGAISNKNVERPQPQEPHIPCLRCLDRAAEEGGCSGEQVTEIKHFLKMFPLLFCFLTVSLVATSGSTIFIEETISLTGYRVDVILLFSNLTRVAEFTASETSSYVIRKLRESNIYNEQKMELVRIGIGTICCLLCCITASVTAARRQREYSMSVYWLTPQYILLGLMGALYRDGFVSFYKSQLSGNLSAHGEALAALAAAVGNFMSIFCLLFFNMQHFRWFQDDVEHSSLDRYYNFLAVLSAVNVVIYCLAGFWLGDDAILAKDKKETVPLAQEANQVILSSIEGQPADAPTQPSILAKENEMVPLAYEADQVIFSSIEGQPADAPTQHSIPGADPDQVNFSSSSIEGQPADAPTQPSNPAKDKETFPLAQEADQVILSSIEGQPADAPTQPSILAKDNETVPLAQEADQVILSSIEGQPADAPTQPSILAKDNETVTLAQEADHVIEGKPADAPTQPSIPGADPVANKG